jgi:hypothetical protein
MQDNNRHHNDDEEMSRDQMEQSLSDAVGDRDVRAGGVLLAIFSVAFLILLSFAIPVGLYTFFSGQDEGPKATVRATPVLPPEPRLSTNEYLDWDLVRESEMSLLHQYGYVNRQAGTARIPIDRAMDILVKRGLPVRQGYQNFPINQEGFAEPQAADWASGQIIQSGR